MILSKHPRNATNTWLRGRQGKSGVVSLQKETRIPRRREPAEGRAQHGICENGRFPWWGQHSTLVAMPHLHLSTCHFSSVTEVSLEGRFAILGIFTDRQAVQQSVCPSYSPPSCHTAYERWRLPRVGSHKP